MEIDPQTSTATENVTIPQAHESPQTLPQAAPSSNTTPPTLVERIRILENKTLRRLVPVAFATSGRPRITIPDSIFQKGAEIHRDFIICYFNGRAPPFSQISKLEIHNNPLNHSTLVRIPSEYLRQKILEKNIWYVGDSMFHTAQWSSAHSKLTPPLKAIQIWAHFTDIPLDLRHEEGYSLAGGLVGEPKEVDEFTKNLVSLPMSHIKVEVDLTVSLPTVVESERENGEVVELAVTYPWVPLTCSHCHELGHIVRNCLLYTPPLGKTSSVQKRIYVSKNPAKTPAKTKKNSHQTPKATGETSTKQKLNDIETTPSKTSTPSNTAP
ncbi:hypothetical protein Bca52824_051095 [Brassica carinata]|uniref:DUF4283 domain-containing protein n=1 Tax=Brassica carinata TaxID=52824 RepID=A0A8X7R0J6_BRACI|nr:hypothetical protein Bca52824_051095 [Brassica carinata]